MGMLCALGTVHRSDVGGAYCCYKMMQIASLSSCATFTDIFCLSLGLLLVIKGVEVEGL